MRKYKPRVQRSSVHIARLRKLWRKQNLGTRGFQTAAFALVVTLFGALTFGMSEPGAAVNPNLAWANNILERYDHLAGASKPQIPVAVEDYLGSLPVSERKPGSGALVNSGGFIETAGKGSRWRYDRHAGIVAASTCCEYQGDLVAYAAAPPVALPGDNLAHVHSKLGLHLGMTPREAMVALGIKQSALAGPSSGPQRLLVVRPFQNAAAAFEGQIVFLKGRAVQIQLGIAHG